MDNQGETVGGNYRGTTINNDIQPGAPSLPLQIDPDVQILRDTIYLAWVNYNQDVSHRQNIFANIMKWMEPDVSGIETNGSIPARIKCYPNPSPGVFTLSLDQKYTGKLMGGIYCYRCNGSA